MKASIRTAQSGDVFVLLTPAHNDDYEVRRRQRALQATLGGRITEPAHLTCQRFEVPDDQELTTVLAALKAALQPLPAIPLTATGFIPFFSRFRQNNILKWSIQEQPTLRQLGALLESTLVQARATPHFRYSAGWVATLITALEGLPDMPDDSKLDTTHFPYDLFVARDVLVTQLQEHREFETIMRFPLLGTAR